MGSGSSSGPSHTTPLSLLLSSSSLPPTGSDLSTPEDTLAEVVRLRHLCREVSDALKEDEKARENLASSKLGHETFRGGSLSSMLTASRLFVDRVLTSGYEGLEPRERGEGMENLRGLLRSTALAVMLARKNVQVSGGGAMALLF